MTFERGEGDITMLVKYVEFRNSLLIMLFCINSYSAQDKSQDYLSIADTLEFSQTEALFRFDPDAWRGNPGARDIIYDLIHQNPMIDSRASMLSYIGIIGDDSDIPKLMGFIPEKQSDTSYMDKHIASGVFAALANLSNRGFDEAGNILGAMTQPYYWKEQNVGYEFAPYDNPFQFIAEEALFTYPYAGRDDFEQLLSDYLETIENLQKRQDIEANLIDRYEKVVKREKEMGTWKARGRPQIAKPRYVKRKSIKVIEEEQKQRKEMMHNVTETVATNKSKKERMTIPVEYINIPNVVSSNSQYLPKIKNKKKSLNTNQLPGSTILEGEYNFAGAGVSLEEMYLQQNKIAKEKGFKKLSYPYRKKLMELYKIVGSKGYNRKELFHYYIPVIDIFLQVKKADYAKAPKTMSVLKMFKNKEKEKVEKFIQSRLGENPNDIPSLLLQYNIHSESGQDKEVFTDVKQIINALDYFNPKGLDKRAILSFVLDDISMFLGYRTQEELNNRKFPEEITLGCQDILYMLEIAGDW